MAGRQQQHYGSVEPHSHPHNSHLSSTEQHSLLRASPPAWNTGMQWLSSKAKYILALVAVGLFAYWMVPRDSNQIPRDENDDYNGPRFPTTVKRYYKEQTFDHFQNDGKYKKTWKQRYYEDREFFAGPGYPIFIILGGEDAVHRILYPFISRVLGDRFAAHTVCLEHRFYGASQPVMNPTHDDLHRLLHPRQALADVAQFIQSKQRELGCGPKGTPQYCPVMTIGASYPGFLSALMRIVHPDLVDIGYASSAPLHLYSHKVDPWAYYEKVTASADAASPGCAHAVKSTLLEVQSHLLSLHQEPDVVSNEAKNLGICPNSVPAYIQDTDMLQQELNMIVATHFADGNMAYYPPTPDQSLVVGCKIFQERHTTSLEKIRKFLLMEQDYKGCFDMKTEVPPGPKGTISAADWSGVGGGYAGLMWDYQSCTLIPECGMSDASMFPLRPWTLDWLTEHCQSRFDYTPQPLALKDEFGFDDLSNVTRLLFTNGLQDGWSVASILDTDNIKDPSSIRVVNMENGAHHSDLSHMGPTDQDTDDVKAAHESIGNLISDWLEEVRAEQTKARV
jgi:hypothetical protein